MRYYTRVLRYLRPYWRLATASVAIMLLGVAASLLAPWPLKILVDNVLSEGPLPSWWQHSPLSLLEESIGPAGRLP